MANAHRRPARLIWIRRCVIAVALAQSAVVAALVASFFWNFRLPTPLDRLSCLFIAAIPIELIAIMRLGRNILLARLKAGLCPLCGYDRTGHSDTGTPLPCPECGRPPSLPPSNVIGSDD